MTDQAESLADIETPRLRLVAMTVERMRADAAGNDALAEALGADVPASWPPEHWEPHVFAFLERQYREAPHTVAWNRYVLLRCEPPALIGTMGGFPKGEEEAEVGYSILAAWQGRGLATEGLLALLKEVFRGYALKSITAQTLPSLGASMRVLEKCGFRPDGVGDEPDTLRFRLNGLG